MQVECTNENSLHGNQGHRLGQRAKAMPLVTITRCPEDDGFTVTAASLTPEPAPASTSSGSMLPVQTQRWSSRQSAGVGRERGQARAHQLAGPSPAPSRPAEGGLWLLVLTRSV